MELVEQTIVPSVVGTSGGDRVVVGEHVVAVLDASTGKPWDPAGGPSTADVADLGEAVIRDTAMDASMEDIVRNCSERLAARKAIAGLRPEEGGCFVFAVVHTSGRWIGRCGDVHVRVDRRPLWSGRRSAEDVVADARALVLRSHLALGANVDALREGDPGRHAVQDVLRALATFRNSTSADGYGAVDGSAVPPVRIEVETLDEDEHEVVLASDGYPIALDTLAGSETSLRQRLLRDPLMIEDPPATKAWRPTDRSFDDRAYARVWLPSQGSS